MLLYPSCWFPKIDLCEIVFLSQMDLISEVTQWNTQMRLWGFHHNTLPALKLFTIFDLSSNAKYLTALSRSGQVCFAFANKLNLNFYPQKFDPSKKSWPLKMLKHAKNPHIIIIVATTQFQRFQTPDLIWLSIILSITKYSAELSQ